MSDDTQKERTELAVFQDFVKRSGRNAIKIENRKSPEPDILCKFRDEGFIAIELKELCEPHIAKVTSDFQRGKIDPKEAVYLRLGPGEDKDGKKTGGICKILEDTLEKKYRSDHPIELLFYTRSRHGVLPSKDQIVPCIRYVYSNRRHGFRRVWFMGELDETCECVFSTSEVNG